MPAKAMGVPLFTSVVRIRGPGSSSKPMYGTCRAATSKGADEDAPTDKGQQLAVVDGVSIAGNYRTRFEKILWTSS